MRIRSQFARERENYIVKWLEENGSTTNLGIPVFDVIPIQFQDVRVDHSPALKRPISLQAPQGSIVHVVGPHSMGKGMILSLMSDVKSLTVASSFVLRMSAC